MDADPDLCVVSIHKTGGGLEQSSVFHVAVPCSSAVAGAHPDGQPRVGQHPGLAAV
jgi:hypothetical protein